MSWKKSLKKIVLNKELNELFNGVPLKSKEPKYYIMDNEESFGVAMRNASPGQKIVCSRSRRRLRKKRWKW